MSKVSICVPVYGVEKYIERCAISLFEQTYPDIDFIFVNDCTKDRSIEILEEVITRYPERQKDIKIINHAKNLGLAAARNTLIENATGEFVFIVDSDDYLALNAVELLLSEQVKGDYDMVIGQIRRFFPTFSNTVYYPCYKSPHKLLVLVLQNRIDHYIWGKLIRRSLLTKNGIRVESGMNSGEDTDLLVKILLNSDTISTIPEIIYFYDYSNSNSLSSSSTPSKSEEYYTHFQVLYHLVDSKGDNELSEACKIGQLRWLVLKQMSAAIHSYNDYYKILKARQKQIDTKYYKQIELIYQPLLYINSLIVIRFIYGIMTKIYHIYRDFRSK